MKFTLPALLCAVLVSACGGGGSSGNTGVKEAQDNSRGYAPEVKGTDGKVSVLFASAMQPAALLGSGRLLAASGVDRSLLTQDANGAFTSLAKSGRGIFVGLPTNTGEVFSHTGRVEDVAGSDGVVAIGRWSDGSDSLGDAYNENQGAVYAVGNPLILTKSAGTLSCRMVHATQPTSLAGNVPPGKVNSAAGTLDLGTLQLANVALDVSIGSDQNYAIAMDSLMLGQMDGRQGWSAVSKVMGTEVTQPYIALAYAADLPQTGDINGLVVLKCEKGS
jgi:hypothetical protein